MTDCFPIGIRVPDAHRAALERAAARRRKCRDSRSRTLARSRGHALSEHQDNADDRRGLNAANRRFLEAPFESAQFVLHIAEIA